jgi:hypothetical protein
VSHDFHPAGAVPFSASLASAAGNVIRVVPSEDQELRNAPGWLSRFSDTYDVMATNGAAGAISGVSGGAPRMASASGTWTLEKLRRRGWDYVLMDADGHHAGSYTGNRWLPGGTISLVDGTQADLRRSSWRAWKLQTKETRERCFDIRTSRGRGGCRLTVTIRSFPMATLDMHLLMLTACVVILLGDTVPGVEGGSGGG